MTYIREDFNGAPFKIGDNVRVVKIDDTNQETHAEDVGKTGKVVAFGIKTHCGDNYPSDPAIIVEGLDWYWKDELELISNHA